MAGYIKDASTDALINTEVRLMIHRRIRPSCRLLVLAVTCLLCIDLQASEQPSATKQDPRYSQIDTLMQTELARSAGPGHALTIGIVEQGRLAWTKSYGVADFTKAASPPDSRTIYPVASVTKVITGIMLLQLVERGVLHLSDPVERFVPEIKRIPNAYPWAPPITLIQLATMTAGIKDQTSGGCSADSPSITWDQCLVKRLADATFGWEPGTQRVYSNTSYAILALALSRAAKRSYTEYVVAEIFKPLEMHDSSFALDARALSRLANPSAEIPRTESAERNPFLGATGVFTTLEDLVKLMRFQLGLGPESVLSRKALEDSFRLIVPSDGDLRYGDGVGFAAVRSADSDLTALGHGGQSIYITSYEFDRSRQSGIVVLTSHRINAYKPLVRKGLKILNPDSSGGTGLTPTEDH
jgi:CubicO group peptidase (beta-lactamase class C family)